MRARDADLDRFETHVGRLLFAGVATSATLLTAGLALWLFRPDSRPAGLVLEAGLFVLMATPILRVIVSIVEYVRMRDWFFVATTLAVLSVLTVTLIYALRVNP